MPRIAALLSYPIDWGHAVRVKSATVGPLGMDGDRRWKVVDEAGAVTKGAAMSQLFLDVRATDLGVSAAGQERVSLPSDGADAWFSKLLGKPVKCVPRGAGEVAPLLATTAASLTRLNQALNDVVGIERFAPSLVLEGTDPFEEDSWRVVKLGGARFTVTRAGPPRLPFGVELRLEGATPVTLRPGQTLEVER